MPIRLHHSTMVSRGACFAVNAPPWDFGRLLGVYVTLFFLVAQAINLMALGIRPHLPVYVGGALIMSGGLVIALWRA